MKKPNIGKSLPLAGVRVIEFEGIGPGPLGGMILADMGAEVLLVSRPQPMALQRELSGGDDNDAPLHTNNPLHRGKRSIAIDLKQPRGAELARRLCAKADALIEGNRPGVMERLGLGPELLHADNPALVYGRMTGWGQSGPLAQSAGHDINYVALSGVMPMAQRAELAPDIPATLIGDSPAGLGLAFGIVCALFAARQSGRGQIVDAAITDIAAYMGSILQAFNAAGLLAADKPQLLQGDAPFYGTYRCADGQWISLGPLEPQFFRLLLEELGFEETDPATQYDASHWPVLKARIAGLIASKPLAEWDARFQGKDVCYAPLLDLQAAAAHPHHQARNTFQPLAGSFWQAAPAPRLSGTQTWSAPASPRIGCDSEAVLRELGCSQTEIDELRAAGVVA